MLKELTNLGREIGMTLIRLNEAGHEDYSEDLTEVYDELVEAIAKQTRPDAERAALMLLSAGQLMRGNSDHGDVWDEVLEKAEDLLGIVPLENAK